MAASGGRHARLVSLEHELGGWTRAIRPPDPRLTLVIPDPDEPGARAAARGTNIVRERRFGTYDPYP